MDGKKQKNRFFLKHAKSSALVLSIAIHAMLILAALYFVAVEVIIKPEQTFEVKEVKRPNMKLRKLRVPVKQSKKKPLPKLRKTIVAKPKTPTVDIKMPELVGVKGGTGYGKGGGGLGGLGFGLEIPDLFGANRGAGPGGNEFVGSFYDLKQTKKGKPTEMNNSGCFELINRFVSSGWSEARLGRYFKAPRQKYATCFMMPVMGAGEAPKAFGVEEEVKPSLWVAHYKGQIAAPETGRYRFCGLGDDALFVRLNRKLVLDACWEDHVGKMSDWESDDENNRKFPLGHSTMVIGDWFELRKGERVEMEVLISEIPGGRFCAMLLIEQEGKEYKVVGGRSVLPVFKTAEIPEKLVPQMKINPSQATAEGPVFGVLTNTR